ncbi:hypothetical protein BCF74_12056 [Knoellia remsis]|uniref:Uncharacterized protein n=1 Tax=Knoellia remsis TaxID=407159 RepID=A0A2T0UDU0_9MICO|nr:hypothetical protein [Knoellia remsis]PRY56106.1 hypothetical protein BCF74_12056 [Knoellia remsis]
MSTQVSYAHWLLGYGRARDRYTTAEAHHRDEAGEEYWVLFGDPERPRQVIQVSERHLDYLVVWLDEELREVLTYLFVPVDKENPQDFSKGLFLEQVHFKEYDSPDLDSAFPSRAGGTYFEHDGSAFHVQNLGNGREESETGPMDPAEAQRLLFEPHPTFGDWTSIARRDR